MELISLIATNAKRAGSQCPAAWAIHLMSRVWSYWPIERPGRVLKALGSWSILFSCCS